LDPETTYLTLVSNFKYNSSITTKDVTTLQTNVLSTIASYSSSSLQNFTGMFRHSALSKNIDAADTAILDAGDDFGFNEGIEFL